MVVSLARRRGGWWTGGRVGDSCFGGEPAASVVENQISRDVGVPCDRELAAVVPVVVVGAQGGEVLGVRTPAGQVRLDVVNLEVGARVAPWVAAGAVAVQHDPAGVRWHDVDAAADVDR